MSDRIVLYKLFAVGHYKTGFHHNLKPGNQSCFKNYEVQPN